MVLIRQSQESLNQYFSECLKNRKMHIKKKKAIMFRIFQYFDMLIGMSATQY